jgi:predicted DNA-binding protein YlxM (UPF0122 family)
MSEYKYELTMKKTAQIKGFSLFLRDWTIKEIADEVGVTSGTVNGWSKKYDWRRRKMRELRDIEQEMRDKTLKARERILDIGTRVLDDVFIRDNDGNIIGVNIEIEDLRDLKVLTETILKTGGVPDKIETVNETTLTGDVNVKTEVVDPEMAAMVGRVIALKQSRGEN